MSWKTYSLGELLDYEQPSKYIVKCTNYNDDYSYPVLTAGQSFILGYTNEEEGVFDKLPVIIFDDFTTATQYVNFKFKVKSSAMKILKPNRELVDPKFIYYRMQLIQFDHSTHKRYWLQHYSKLNVSIPKLQEQQCIVAHIEELFSELDAGTNELWKIKEKLKIYKLAIYSLAFKDNDKLLPITNFFEITGGITKNSKREELPIKRPYLRVANVYYNRLDLTEIKEIGVTERDIEKCTLKKNDLLFVEGNGSKEQIGRVAIWDGSIEGCVHQNHLIKGRPLGGMLPEYALSCLISAVGRNQILEAAKSTSGLYTLSTNKVKGIQLPYCGIDEQQRRLRIIQEKLSVCDAIENAIDSALSKASYLRQSILKQAFEGRI